MDKRRHTAYQQDQLFFVGRCVLSFEFVNGSRPCSPELAVSSARLSRKSFGQHTGIYAPKTHVIGTFRELKRVAI